MPLINLCAKPCLNSRDRKFSARDMPRRRRGRSGPDSFTEVNTETQLDWPPNDTDERCLQRLRSTAFKRSLYPRETTSEERPPKKHQGRRIVEGIHGRRIVEGIQRESTSRVGRAMRRLLRAAPSPTLRRMLLMFIGCVISVARTNGRTVSDVNLALNQSTYSSSVYSECGANGCLSQHVVDGNRTTQFAQCFVTNEEDNPWWAVRLGTNSTIALVVVTNKSPFGDHLADFTIGLTDVAPTDQTPNSLSSSDYTLCAYHEGAVPDGQTVELECGTCNPRGRFLSRNNLHQRRTAYDDRCSACHRRKLNGERSRISQKITRLHERRAQDHVAFVSRSSNTRQALIEPSSEAVSSLQTASDLRRFKQSVLHLMASPLQVTSHRCRLQLTIVCSLARLPQLSHFGHMGPAPFRLFRYFFRSSLPREPRTGFEQVTSSNGMAYSCGFISVVTMIQVATSSGVVFSSGVTSVVTTTQVTPFSVSADVTRREEMIALNGVTCIVVVAFVTSFEETTPLDDVMCVLVTADVTSLEKATPIDGDARVVTAADVKSLWETIPLNCDTCVVVTKDMTSFEETTPLRGVACDLVATDKVAADVTSIEETTPLDGDTCVVVAADKTGDSPRVEGIHRIVGAIEGGWSPVRWQSLRDGSLESLRDGSLESLRDGSLESLRDGSLESLRDGSLESLRDGSLESLRDVSLESLRDGSLESLRDGSIESLRVGFLESLRDGSLESLRDGSLESLRDSSLESLRDGFLESLRDGSLESLRDGSLESLRDGRRICQLIEGQVNA
ncbi:hypothetical protein LSAT2_019629 [Lamellibrachia satsuma]|nr:hypothetical protein LSAT2_019629 [Lamellibrachia satsuma]